MMLSILSNSLIYRSLEELTLNQISDAMIGLHSLPSNLLQADIGYAGTGEEGLRP